MTKRICCLLLLSSLVGCATTPGEKELEKRSDYLSDLKVLDIGYQTPKDLPRRSGEMALVWRHEAQLPSGDYFWGGWVSLTVNKAGFGIGQYRKQKKEAK